MNKNRGHSPLRTLFALSAVCALGFGGTALAAGSNYDPEGAYAYGDSYSQNDPYAQDDTYANPGPTEEVVVPGYIERHERGAVVTGRPFDPNMRDPVRISLTRGVGFGDLDLTTRAGARELRARVAAAASDVCNELHFRYPKNAPGVTYSNYDTCESNARNGALREANRIIADVRGDYARVGFLR